MSCEIRLIVCKNNKTCNYNCKQLTCLTDGEQPDDDMMSHILDLCASSVDESFVSGDDDERDDIAQEALQKILRDFSRQLADQIAKTSDLFTSSGEDTMTSTSSLGRMHKRRSGSNHATSGLNFDIDQYIALQQKLVRI